MPNEPQNQTTPEDPMQIPPEPDQPPAAPSPYTPEQPAVNTAVPITGTTPASPQLPVPPAPVTSKNSRKLKLLAALVAALLVVVGGSAAAYYAVVVPNKPENVLKKAISNTALQKKAKFDGKISYESTDPAASLKAVNVTFNGAADTDANNFGTAFEITASGAKLPIEVRHVDKSVFFKIGDLGSIKGLAQAAAPEYGTVVDTLNKKIANQWVEVDETLLKQANADCALNTSFALSQEDIDILQKRFDQVPFASVKSTSDDTVNGHSAIKYEINIDDNKGAEYVKGLDELPLVKKIKQCNPSSQQSATDTTKSLADNDITPLTLWVDKDSKQIVKLAGQSTKQDETKDKFKATFEVTLQYGQASVTKPDGAKPFMEVFGDLSQLFGSLGQNTDTSISSSQLGHGTGAEGNVEGVSPECLKAIQDYANSSGTKPIPQNCL